MLVRVGKSWIAWRCLAGPDSVHHGGEASEFDCSFSKVKFRGVQDYTIPCAGVQVLASMVECCFEVPVPHQCVIHTPHFVGDINCNFVILSGVAIPCGDVALRFYHVSNILSW
jgi:hypothetical protein